MHTYMQIKIQKNIYITRDLLREEEEKNPNTQEIIIIINIIHQRKNK